MQTNNKALKFRLMALAIGLSLLILLGAWWLFVRISGNIRQNVYNELQAITGLKAQQLTRWHRERMSEAEYFSQNQYLVNQLLEHFRSRGPFPVEEMRHNLQHVVRTHSYFNILFVAPQRQIIFSFVPEKDIHSPSEENYFARAFETAKIQVRDLYYCPDHGEVLYDIIAPMVAPDGEVIALMVFRIQPHVYMYPLVQDWPTPSQTAETILLRAEGDSLVFLNEPRHHKNLALRHRVGLQQHDQVSARAFSRGEGPVTGIDYRGEKVIAYAAVLDDFPWIMLSKMDRREAFADVYFRVGVVGGFTLMLLLMLWLMMGWIFGQQQKMVYRALFLKEEELARSREEFRVALYSIADGVIVCDTRGLVSRMNPMATQITGFGEQQAAGKPLEQVIRLKDPKTRQPRENPFNIILQQARSISFNDNILLVPGNNPEEIPVQITASPILDEQQVVQGVVLVIRDQTQQQQAKLQLKESEEKYRSLVEVSTDAIFIDQDNRLVYVNPAGLALFGADSPGELLGRAPLDFFPRELHPAIRERVRLMQATGRPTAKAEMRIIRLDGQQVDVELDAVPFIFNNKRVIQVILHDISERKQAEQALKASEEKHRKLFETMSQGVVYLDQRGFVSNVNPAAERILGRPASQLRGFSLFDDGWKIVGEDGKPLLPADYPAVGALGSGKKVQGFVMGIMNPQSEQYTWVRLNATPVYGQGDPSPAGVHVTMEDITHLKKIETDLREIAARYHMLFESNPHPMWVFEQQSLRFLDVNRAALSRYGYSREEFLQMSLMDILVADEIPRLKVAIDGASKGFAFPSEWRHRLADGSQIDVETTSQALEYQGKNARLVLITDITERKQNLQLREDIILARQATELKQRFLATMSHELRTPLSGIIGMTEILSQTQVDELQNDYIQTIRTSSEHLMQVVNNILDLSRIEAGKMTLRPAVFPFGKLLDKADKLYHSISRKEIAFTMEVDHRLPEFIYADEQKIFQIITNLLGNAIKFTEKGQIILRADLLESLADEQLLIRIQICDTGVGISRASQKKLFQFFSQAEDDAASPAQGSGLGLAISRELTHQLGGEIGVNSNPGRGSTFWFTFVAARATPPQAEEASPETSPQPARRFLLVEDNRLIRKVITLMLEEMGHQVREAKNGLDALSVFEQEKFDVILMDIHMPIMDGITAMKKLREKYQNLPPVVGLSANAFEADAQRFIGQGMDDYLTKPVKPSDFENLLRKWFGG